MWLADLFMYNLLKKYKNKKYGAKQIYLCSTISWNQNIYLSHFTYVCKTEGKKGISHLISALCVNCLISILEYSRLNHLDVYLV